MIAYYQSYCLCSVVSLVSLENLLAVGACLYIHSIYAHKMMNYRHTKHTRTHYTDHIRLLIEKASILFFS